MRLSAAFSLALFATSVVAKEISHDSGNLCGEDADLRTTHPVLCEMLDALQADPEGLADSLKQFARQYGLLVGDKWEFPVRHSEFPAPTTSSSQQLPVVFAHGMGDSCFNNGMIDIGKHTSSLLDNVYVTCIPTGDTQAEDTTNGYFLSMDASVDVFAAKVAMDPKLTNGFHAIGFSQGNNVIRGYIARYNTPTVHTFLAVNGVNAGEGTVPGCFPNKSVDLQEQFQVGGFCDLLLEQASRRAYTEFAQQHSFQAGYWRDPRRKEQEAYYQYSQLARWNNEGPQNKNETLNANYAKTSKFVWVKATEDSMVWPKEGEQWGCPDPDDPFTHILPMNETEWYKEDLFGLKTAQEAGKNYFETFVGDHLQFSMQDFNRWITTYLKDATVAEELNVSMA
ncbi:palmitoyl protein thioesterase [Nitzschia inconspicua]|uniref:Palmitoyl protein thioesterase n=1 Tax=Nitzschia inconspicua TaxID=303405 RepID=A0A9K3Q8N5_9STRA|nr:palmitoyl protein thioesterase [Nitzschia inconspicua]